MCKKCAKDISPYLVGCKQFSVDDMESHLANREKNKEKMEAFNVTRTIGAGTKVIYFDQDKGQFLLAAPRGWKGHIRRL